MGAAMVMALELVPWALALVALGPVRVVEGLAMAKVWGLEHHRRQNLCSPAYQVLSGHIG